MSAIFVILLLNLKLRIMIGTYKVFTADGDFATVIISGNIIGMTINWDSNGGNKCDSSPLDLTTEEWFEMNEVTEHIKID